MTNLSVAELERLAVRAERDVEVYVWADWCRNVTLARVCRHALALEAEVARLRGACVTMQHEIQQTLGKALGYPAAYPDVSTADDGAVVVGEHIAETLALEAAETIARLRRQVEARRHEVHEDDGEQ
jgi:hypothetical protein